MRQPPVQKVRVSFAPKFSGLAWFVLRATVCDKGVVYQDLLAEDGLFRRFTPYARLDKSDLVSFKTKAECQRYIDLNFEWRT